MGVATPDPDYPVHLSFPLFLLSHFRPWLLPCLLGFFHSASTIMHHFSSLSVKCGAMATSVAYYTSRWDDCEWHNMWPEGGVHHGAIDESGRKCVEVLILLA